MLKRQCVINFIFFVVAFVTMQNRETV